MCDFFPTQRELIEQKNLTDKDFLLMLDSHGIFPAPEESEEEFRKRILQEYDFLSDVDKEHFIDQEGYELYFVVPKTEESSLIINDYAIFERFYRVDKSHSKMVNGTGLGLSIVKHIAKNNNVNISVDSVIDKGTTFVLDFSGT